MSLYEVTVILKVHAASREDAQERVEELLDDQTYDGEPLKDAVQVENSAEEVIEIGGDGGTDQGTATRH